MLHTTTQRTIKMSLGQYGVIPLSFSQNATRGQQHTEHDSRPVPQSLRWYLGQTRGSVLSLRQDWMTGQPGPPLRTQQDIGPPLQKLGNFQILCPSHSTETESDKQGKLLQPGQPFRGAPIRGRPRGEGPWWGGCREGFTGREVILVLRQFPVRGQVSTLQVGGWRKVEPRGPAGGGWQQKGHSVIIYIVKWDYISF